MIDVGLERVRVNTDQIITDVTDGRDFTLMNLLDKLLIDVTYEQPL